MLDPRPRRGARLREKLAAEAQDSTRDDLEIVMRVYFEKPRTTVGWKGLINDPYLDGSFRINEGLRLARDLLVRINEAGRAGGLRVPRHDLAAVHRRPDRWGAIGARTTESQVHRELASGLSARSASRTAPTATCDRGRRDARRAAAAPFPVGHKSGQVAIVETRGNEDCHIILRGGKAPNYDAASVDAACAELAKAKLPARLMIDCSHANAASSTSARSTSPRDVARADRRRRAAHRRRDGRVPPRRGPPGPRRRQAAAPSARASPTPASAGRIRPRLLDELAEAVRSRRGARQAPQ